MHVPPIFFETTQNGWCWLGETKPVPTLPFQLRRHRLFASVDVSVCGHDLAMSRGQREPRAYSNIILNEQNQAAAYIYMYIK